MSRRKRKQKSESDELRDQFESARTVGRVTPKVQQILDQANSRGGGFSRQRTDDEIRAASRRGGINRRAWDGK